VESDSETDEEVHDEDAVGLSYVGHAVYEKLRTLHASTHNECWNVTHGKIVGQVQQSPPPQFWGAPDIQPVEQHSDFFPSLMYDLIVKAEKWVDITSLSPPDGKFMTKFRDAMTVLAKKADQKGEPIVVRMLFGNIIGMPVDCTAVIEDLTENISTNTNLELWVGAWRKGISWNHSKIIAVDGKYLFNGGHNLWDGHYLQKNPVHDVSMQAEGDVAHDGHVFANKMWEYIEKTQDTLLGRIEAQLPDWLPLAQTFRVSVSAFPEDEIGEYPPMYEHETIRFSRRRMRRMKYIPMITMGRYGRLHQWGGIWGNKANPSDSAITTAFSSAKKIIRMSLQDLGPLCLPFQFGSETPTSIPGGCWPDAYLRELAIAIYERGVDVEIALSPPHCVPGDLSPATANYGNGWSCVDVASEIIKAVLVAIPDADHQRLRLMVRDNLRLCYVNSKSPMVPLGNHAKHWYIDDKAYYVGSQNLYVCNLAEWGVLVDNQQQTQRVLAEYWFPMWNSSYVEDKDADVDEVMDSLDVDRCGEDPLKASLETKLRALEAHRKSCLAPKAKHNDQDVDEVAKHFVMESHEAERFRISY